MTADFEAMAILAVGTCINVLCCRVACQSEVGMYMYKYIALDISSLFQPFCYLYLLSY